MISLVTHKTACPVEQAVLFWHQQLGHLSWVLGYSGGMDSSVLLHAIKRLEIPVKAVHVHYGLHAQADDWALHCQRQAALLDVPLVIHRVQLPACSRRGVEDRAREVRYNALWSEVDVSGCLLTAHHQRDQAETVLLHLMRGAGVKGLSGINVYSEKSATQKLLRPLLSVSYDALCDYAQRHDLVWIEDPSNDHLTLRRNYMRYEVLPKLHPEGEQVASRMLVRATQAASEALQLTQMLAQSDWDATRLDRHQLSLSKWRQLPWIRAKNLLLWLSSQFAPNVNLTEAQTQQIYTQFYVATAQHSHAQLSVSDLVLILDRNTLWLLLRSEIDTPSEVVSETSIRWGEWANLSITLAQGEPSTVRLEACRWRMRCAGVSIQTCDGVKRLKSWLEDQRIPYWQRQRWPVLHHENGDVIGWANMPKAWWPWDMEARLVVTLD